VAKYYAYEAEVLRVAFSVKSAYYRLHFLEENLHVQQEMLQLLNELEQLAQQQNATGLATLQDTLRVQIEQDSLKNQIVNLEDSRSILVADLKAALGLGPNDSDPPVPAVFVSSEGVPDQEEILQIAQQRNPEIGQLAADVRRAQSVQDLASRSGVPDYAVGAKVDFKRSPALWSPTASMTLPVWRDKIAAEIAGAQANKRAAQARLSEEQIQLAAELATLMYMYRESVRNRELLEEQLIPKGQQSLQVARVGYANSQSSFLDVIDAYRQLLGFELELIEAQTQRELALASLSLLIAGTPPQGSVVLSPVEEALAVNMKEDLR
jgi:outer membrane protein TolC